MTKISCISAMADLAVKRELEGPTRKNSFVGKQLPDGHAFRIETVNVWTHLPVRQTARAGSSQEYKMGLKKKNKKIPSHRKNVRPLPNAGVPKVQNSVPLRPRDRQLFQVVAFYKLVAKHNNEYNVVA